MLDVLETERMTALHPQDADPVFATGTGRPESEENASRRGMRVATEAAGVPWARWYDLRRAAITRWIVDARLDPKKVQRLAGHHDAAVTLNAYARLGDRLPDGELLGALQVGRRSPRIARGRLRLAPVSQPPMRVAPEPRPAGGSWKWARTPTCRA